MVAKVRTRKGKEAAKVNIPEPPPQPSTRMDILAKASDLTSGDRNKSYGSPKPNMECFTALQLAFINGVSASSQGNMPAGVFASIIHCLNKISRIAANPAHMDNYVDLAAYGGIAGECASESFGVPC